MRDGMKVFSHNNQDVVIWSTSPTNQTYSPYDEVSITVSYSYLRSEGRLGKVRSARVFEADFGDEFRPTDRKIILGWQEK